MGTCLCSQPRSQLKRSAPSARTGRHRPATGRQARHAPQLMQGAGRGCRSAGSGARAILSSHVGRLQRQRRGGGADLLVSALSWVCSIGSAPAVQQQSVAASSSHAAASWPAQAVLAAPWRHLPPLPRLHRGLCTTRLRQASPQPARCSPICRRRRRHCCRHCCRSPASLPLSAAALQPPA